MCVCVCACACVRVCTCKNFNLVHTGSYGFKRSTCRKNHIVTLLPTNLHIQTLRVKPAPNVRGEHYLAQSHIVQCAHLIVRESIPHCYIRLSCRTFSRIQKWWTQENVTRSKEQVTVVIHVWQCCN